MGGGGWVFKGLRIGGRGPGVGGRIGSRVARGAVAEALQLGESTVEGTLGGIDAALEEVELLVGAGDDLAERSCLAESTEGVRGIDEFVSPELGFRATETAKLPIGADEFVDEGAFGGSGRLPLEVVVAGEGFELAGNLAGDDLRFGFDAGFERVEAGNGFSFGRARARGLLSVSTVGFDLQLRRHFFSRLENSGRGGGDRGWMRVSDSGNGK